MLKVEAMSVSSKENSSEGEDQINMPQKKSKQDDKTALSRTSIKDISPLKKPRLNADPTEKGNVNDLKESQSIQDVDKKKGEKRRQGDFLVKALSMTMLGVRRSSMVELDYISIFKMPFEDRSEQHNNLITERLKKFDFFKTKFDKLKEDDENNGLPFLESIESFILEISKYLQLERLEAGQILFHKGDVGKKMYFIHEGQVSIVIPKKQEDVTKQRKTFMDIRDNQIRINKYKEPTLDQVYEVAQRLLPNNPYNEFKKAREQEIDEN